MPKPFLVINDRVYGREPIYSPVITALIKSAPLKRLEKISQFGVPDEFYHLKNITRLEHSLGVMILLKRLGASEEEQIAGLIHDVSHTAFSHVIDWVIGDGGEEDHQDNAHANFVAKSEIPKILKKFGYDADKIGDLRNYRLLDREKPHLCADRIDYALREFGEKTVRDTLKHLKVVEGRIVFDDVRAANQFASAYLKKQMEHWGGYEAASRYRMLGNILKFALDNKIIKFSDFWRDDEYVIKKLKSSKNKKILSALKELRNKSLKDFPKSREIAHKKFRYVDPEVLVDRSIKRLFMLDKEFAEKIKKAEIINGRGIYLPASESLTINS
ncbi:MAG: HD domain-containing protein [Patescibacteria group bacterium]|nr:HD domain-containing protein [Patescibacteria group bacterium]